jgi:lysine 2,3-aminomutase
LVGALRGHLSGLCQPSYVLDLPGGFGKVPVGKGHLAPAGSPGLWEVTDFRGAKHCYQE